MKHYEYFEVIMKDSKTNLSITSQSTTRQRLLPMLIDKVFAPSQVYNYPINNDHDMNVTSN